VLQRYRSDDASGILELVHRNRAQLIRDFEQQAGLQSLADAQAFTADKEEQWSCGKTFCYGIWRKPAKEQVGQIQVKNIDWEIPRQNRSISSSFQRHGYAIESSREILELAFEKLGFRRIFVRILPSNRESFSLAKKLGFRE
jgi:RimJ/RimL family protein N-acetyltransferase